MEKTGLGEACQEITRLELVYLFLRISSSTTQNIPFTNKFLKTFQAVLYHAFAQFLFPPPMQSQRLGGCLKQACAVIVGTKNI